MTTIQATRTQTATRRRPARTVSCVVSLLLVLTSCSIASDGDQASADEFWSSLRITGDEVEGYTTLNTMTQASDAVIIGRFVNFGVSRQLQGDAEEDVVTYGKATVTVDEAVAGSGVDSAITLEFLLNVSPDGIDTLVKELQSRLPTAPMVLFLREKRGPGEVDLYRIVNSDGLWVATDRGIETPLSGNVDVATSDALFPARYYDELAGVTSLDDFVVIVKK